MTHAGWLLVEPDGSMLRCPGPARTAVPERFGHPLAAGNGLVRVGLVEASGAVGWHAAEVDGRPRNPVGACLLVALGGPRKVVAGPVAVTGWSRDLSAAEATAGTAGRTIDLTRAQVSAVELLHRDIMSVLSGREVDRPAEWIVEIQAYAAYVVEETEPLPRDADRALVTLAAEEHARRFLAREVF